MVTFYALGKEISEWIAKFLEVRIKPRTIEQRARRQNKNATNVAKPDLQRKQTPTEIKFQLNNVAKDIKAGKVSDEDLKSISDGKKKVLTSGQ